MPVAALWSMPRRLGSQVAARVHRALDATELPVSLDRDLDELAQRAFAELKQRRLVELVERPSTTTAGLGAALLLALIIVRSVKRRRPEESRPTRASATITISLPRWRARA